MSRKNSNNINEQWFIDKGYTWDSTKNQFVPPPVKSRFIQQLKGNPDPDIVIERKEVIKTNQFEYMPKLKWFIKGQVPSKKNSRQVFVHPKTKKLMNIPSKLYANYKNDTKEQWKTFGREFRASIEYHKLDFPLNIEMTFIRKTNQLVDFFGPGESVFDLMTEFGWWEDDNRRFGKPFFGDMMVDKNNAGVIIRILTKDDV